MRFAFGVLKLSPDVFWNLSLDEFAAMLPLPGQAPEALSRQEYTTMKQEQRP